MPPLEENTIHCMGQYSPSLLLCRDLDHEIGEISFSLKTAVKDFQNYASGVSFLDHHLDCWCHQNTHTHMCLRYHFTPVRLAKITKLDNIVMRSVFICQGCYTKLPQIEQLRKEKFIVSHSKVLKSEMKVLAGPCSFCNL